MRSSWRTRLAVIVLLAAAGGRVSAQQPATTAFTYQGRLLAGGASQTGSYDFQFKLFDALAAGNQIGSTVTLSAVQVTGGLFTVSLDFGQAFNSQRRWLHIGVRPAGGGTFTALIPRQEITAAPHAEGLVLPVSVTTSVATPALNITNGNGTAFAVSGGADGIDAFSQGLNGNGIVAECDNGSVAYGVWGRSSSGYGVVGNGSGGAIGGAFYADSNTAMYAASASSINSSTSGAGVVGVAHAASGIPASAIQKTGVWGDTDIGNGVVGTTSSTAPRNAGVVGWAQNPNGSGVLGISHTLSGITLITNPAVWGDSDTGHGVVGTTSTTSSTTMAPIAGVLGFTMSASAIGVWGDNTSSSGDAFGVVGITHSSSGYAGYFEGRMTATGTKNFQIDHPLDPENMYLNHYCTESPEPQNAYNGLITTDANGDAWALLPDYFQEINRDFRYTLTVVDENDFALARVAREIRGNQFAIKTSRPYVKVSWEVKGVRNDRFVRAYGAPTEQAKPVEKRGSYLQPELYGMPRERGQFFLPAIAAPAAQSAPGKERR